ncbi:DUF1254 domain-containing protein [Orrella sp. JC864]|uniref:DUF1254 domain-containing protein n=1 Tax=Orrella sp. JC864 TaxID=3120298 RepID=UPI00300A87C9
MRRPLFSSTCSAAVLAGAFGLAVVFAAQAQPQHSLRLVSETPVSGQGGAQPLQHYATVAPMSGQELRETAVDAYVYAYPLVLQEVTRRIATSAAGPGRAPINQWGHTNAFPSADTPHAAWPSQDMLYSNLWFDLTAEPLIVHLPDAGGRYYFAPIFDAWSDQFAVRGPRTTGGGEQVFALVGPEWRGALPNNIEIVRSPTATGWMSVRVQANGAKDIANVAQFQSGLSATPMSQSRYAAPPAPMGPSAAAGAGRAWMPTPLAQQPAAQQSQQPVWDTQTPAAEQVARMDANTFFTLYAESARVNPPHANDYPILDRLRRIGLDARGGVPFANLDPVVQRALAEAAPAAGERIREALTRAGTGYNGWRTVLRGIGTYGTDYTQRAAIAYAGLGANTIEDAIYPVALMDEEGELLDGRRDYVIHFRKDELPPVNAFWSINLYGPNHGYIPNQANRHSLGSRDPLTYNPDGSLTLYVSHDAPRESRRANWLPAPESGPFSLNMRLYWPKADALDGKWAPPLVRRD